jgi:hypothetical protein
LPGTEAAFLEQGAGEGADCLCRTSDRSVAAGRVISTVFTAVGKASGSGPRGERAPCGRPVGSPVLPWQTRRSASPIPTLELESKKRSRAAARPGSAA